MIFARRRSSCALRPLVGAEHLERRAIVDVFAVAERVDQRLLPGEVRQDAQLDLRVVGRDQHVARLGDERAPDLAADVGPDRNVLQVRIAAAQAPGRGHRLVEAGVHAAGVGIDERRQRVDVGALQLLQAAPLEDQLRQLVRQRQLLEHLERGRLRLGLGRPPDRLGAHAEPVEEDLRQLLRRVDVELLAGELVDASRRAATAPDRRARPARRAPPCRCARRRARSRRAPGSAAARARRRRAAARPASAAPRSVADELQREVGALAGVVERALERDVGERDGLRAAPADVLLAAAPCSRCARSPDPRADATIVRVEQVAGDHHVGVEAAQRDAVPARARWRRT